jgi:hypothetical protein
MGSTPKESNGAIPNEICQQGRPLLFRLAMATALGMPTTGVLKDKTPRPQVDSDLKMNKLPTPDSLKAREDADKVERERSEKISQQVAERQMQLQAEKKKGEAEVALKKLITDKMGKLTSSGGEIKFEPYIYGALSSKVEKGKKLDARLRDSDGEREDMIRECLRVANELLNPYGWKCSCRTSFREEFNNWTRDCNTYPEYYLRITPLAK